MKDEQGGDLTQLTAFFVGDEEYVVDIMRVREIIRPLPITPVRRGPRYVEGVINLRGAVIPVIDMRKRFGMSPASSLHRKIIIMSIDRRTFGLIVDQVSEVIRIPRHQVQPAPGLLNRDAAPFFLGVCRFEDRQLILLNVKNIVGTDSTINVPSADEILGGGAE